MLKILATQTLIIQISAILLVTLLINLAADYFLRHIHYQLKTKNLVWDKAIYKTVRKPLSILIWFLGLSYVIDIIHLEDSHFVFYKMVPTLRFIVGIILVAWTITRLLRQVEKIYIHTADEHKTGLDKTNVNAVCQILRGVTVLAAILIGLQTLGYSISGLLTLGGVSTLVAGLAAKDLLANFFGGLMIYMDRPFKVGDWVRSPDRNIEGTVEYIGWRLSRIRTFDKQLLFVPNAIFSTIILENPSRMLNRRIKAIFGLRYCDVGQMAVIIKECQEMLQQHPDIDTTTTFYVHFSEVAASSLNFTVYAFTKTIEWLPFIAIQQDVFFKVLAIIAAHGAECAFNTTTLDIPQALSLANCHPAADRGTQE